MRTAVLTYHGVSVNGDDYASNDHIALQEDLRLIAALGLPIIPLQQAVDALLDPGLVVPDRCVAISCDDGSWFDWHDLPHPAYGVQRGFRGILQDHIASSGQAAHLTSFVIASPAARADLDRLCLIDQGWWDDGWWPEAASGGLIAIENHSWDHNHQAVEQRILTDTAGGDFHSVCSHAQADAQIRQAADYLDRRCAPERSSLFAYPYGHSSDYLRREYLPEFQSQHRLRAAFTTEPRPLSAGEDRWALGRYVCGVHWRSPDALRQLLQEALGMR